MAPSRAALKGSTPASPSSDADDDFSPSIFQASLDDALASARSLVEGWIPKGLGPEWDTAGNGQTAQQGVQQLKDRARLPRLGLGASPSALHQQQAEDRKLAKQLGLSSRPSTSFGDEGAVVASARAGTGAEGDVEADEESSSDEEESRTRAVGKGKAKANGLNGVHGGEKNGKGKKPAHHQAAKQAPNNPFVLNGTSSSSAFPTSGAAATKPTSPSASPSASAPKPLFNAPSPVKPSASSSSSTAPPAPTAPAKPGLSSSAFYSAAAPSPAVPADLTGDLSGLSKNQRKKLREKQARMALKRKAEEESRAEHEAESGVAAKKARVEEGEREREEGGAGEEEREKDGDGVEETEKGGDEGEGGEAGGAGKKKKKKKRKSKGGNGAAGGEEPLLNLG